MRFDYILDEVFATWSHISVLRILMNTTRPLSGREIARLAHMTHRSCLRALTRLEYIGFVNRNRGGRDHLFTINREHRSVARRNSPHARNRTAASWASC